MENFNISHAPRFSDIGTAINTLKKVIKDRGDLSYISVCQQIQILEEMCKFELGSHILMTGGADGYWTDYMISYPWECVNIEACMMTLNRLEYYLIFESLITLSQRDLFQIIQKELQHRIKENSVIASIPCGLMRDLLCLDYSGIANYSLIGIDIDEKSVQKAKQLAKKKKISNVEFIFQNAWDLNLPEKADLISSIGLNVYENDPDKVIELYRQINKSLKPGGALLTGVMTYPPNNKKKSDWNLSKIDEFFVSMDKIFIEDVLNLNFQNYRTLEEIEVEFKRAGFREVSIIPDKRCIYPAVVAYK